MRITDLARRDIAKTHGTAAARPVVQDDGHGDEFLVDHDLVDDPRQQVGAAANREGNHEFDFTGRCPWGLGTPRPDGCHERRGRCSTEEIPA